MPYHINAFIAYDSFDYQCFPFKNLSDWSVPLGESLASRVISSLLLSVCQTKEIDSMTSFLESSHN